MHKKQTIKIKRKNGAFTIKGNGDEYLWQLASGAFARGEMQPTFGYKLRRFCRRLVRTVNAKIADAYATVVMLSLPASELPYIGVEDVNHGQ